METLVAGMLWSAMAAGTVIVIAGLGELMAEKTGVMNLGIEGVMAMGAVTAALVVNNVVPNVFAGLLAAGLIGMLLGALFAVASVTINANPFLIGLGLALLGDGISRQIGSSVNNQPVLDRLSRLRFPVLTDLPVVGTGLFNHNFMVYIAYLILPLAVYWLLQRTRHGLSMRATGQDPATADACGVAVRRIRFWYASVAGLMFGVAGAYLTLGLTRSWSEGVIGGRGWITLALVFFSGWNPWYLLFGAVLFGASTSLGYVLQLQGLGDPYLLGLLPYIATLLLVVAGVLVRRKKRPARSGIGPAALGLPYYRE